MTDVLEALPPGRRSGRAPFVPRVRLARIAWRLLPWVAFSGLLVLVVHAWAGSGALRHQAHVVALAVLAGAVVLAVGREILSPDRPALRLLPLSDARARQFAAVFRVLVLVALVSETAIWLIRENGWRMSVADTIALARTLLVVVLVAGTLVATGIPRRLRSMEADTWRGLVGRFLANVAFPVAVLGALFLVVSAGLGYVPLTRYVFQNLLWSLAGLLVAVLAFRYLRLSLQRAVSFLREREGHDPAVHVTPQDVDATALGIERIGSGLLRIGITLGTVLWLLSEWGITPAAAIGALNDPIVEGASLTWGNLVGGIAEIGAVLFAGWLVRSVLTYFVFPRSRVGIGARYAILAMLRYTVVALAVILGLSALGVDTSSLSWFFGAAGIGIGLGLQDIIGNFFSGLIMLVERPIRVGDIVSLGDAMGTVENIRMRGTTLRTYDNTTVLIPNRQLLGDRVTNLTYGMSHARILVQVGVSYDADPERVRRILLDVASSNEHIIQDPPPNVWFSEFGASSLDFTLIGYTDQLRGRMGVASAVRFEVFRRLKEEEIEIPFPQRDLHIRSGWEPRKP